MLKTFEISDFDVRINISNLTITGTGQEILTIPGTPTYENVWAKEVKSNLSNDSETLERGFVTGFDNRSFAVRKNNMSISRRSVVQLAGDTEYYHVIGIHAYGSDRNYIVLECRARDND